MILVTALALWLFAGLSVPAAWTAPYTDAEVLALEISSELLPPPDLVIQITSDLTAIRAHDPYFEAIHVMPTWMPGDLLIGLSEEAIAQFHAGTYHGLDSLNAEYGPVDVRNLILNWLHLEFSEPYHPVVLASLYVSEEGVLFVEPNGMGVDGDDIIATELGEYTFKHGWGDCPSGCISDHYWVFTVVDGHVILVREYGDDVPVAQSTWGELKSRFRSVR